VVQESDAQKSKYKQCSPELLDALAENVIRLRAERELSQEALAEKAGLHRTFISLVERRGRNVTLGVIEALANALNVSVPELLTKQENGWG
jgi:transcriptional regulator with XRE-family HTH domain